MLDARLTATAGFDQRLHYLHGVEIVRFDPAAVDRDCFFDGYCGCTSGYVDADFGQSIDKQLTVFCVADGLNGRAQNIHTEFAQYAFIVLFQTAVQRRLTTE